MRPNSDIKTLNGHKANPGHPPLPDDAIEALQLERLASAVLTKSPADLAALAEANPHIVWEWLEAFRRQRVEAAKRERYWSEAVASLAKAQTGTRRTAAE